MAELSLIELFDKCKEVNPQPPTFEDFKDLMEREYRAY